MPVVPDYTVYPTGRDLADTRGEIGLSGHRAKLMMHYLFIYKAKGPSRLAADPGVSDMAKQTFSPTPDLRSAPLPTEKTLRMRRNLPYQAYRFAAFTLRILRMVVKGQQ